MLTFLTIFLSADSSLGPGLYHSLVLQENLAKFLLTFSLYQYLSFLVEDLGSLGSLWLSSFSCCCGVACAPVSSTILLGFCSRECYWEAAFWGLSMQYPLVRLVNCFWLHFELHTYLILFFSRMVFLILRRFPWLLHQLVRRQLLFCHLLKLLF